jgi:hypothetical protein
MFSDRSGVKPETSNRSIKGEPPTLSNPWSETSLRKIRKNSDMSNNKSVVYQESVEWDFCL